MKKTVHEIQVIDARLRKVSAVDDSRKTEAMKVEEKELIDQRMDLVDKKNELLLQQDVEEQAIAEDEILMRSLDSASVASSVGPVKDALPNTLQRLFFKAK